MKHINKKYSKILTGLAIFLGGIATIYVVAQQSTTEFRLDDQLDTAFGYGFTQNYQNIDFKYGGNKKAGLFLPRSSEILVSGEVVVLDGGNTGFCFEKIRGVYYNNQRGERIRPIDQDSLSKLQALHSSYNDIELTGGLFTNCTGIVGTTGNVFGQVEITYNNTHYYIMGGTDYDFTNNTHGLNFDTSLTRGNNTLSGHIWDNYGGIGKLIGTVNTGTINTGNTYSEELIGAYNYAYNLGLNTQSTIDQANMYGELTEGETIDILNIFADYVGFTQITGYNGISGSIATRGFFISNIVNMIWPGQFTTQETIYEKARAEGITTNTNNMDTNQIRGYAFLTLQTIDESYIGSNGGGDICSTAENILACTLGTLACPVECQPDPCTLSGASIGACSVVNSGNIIIPSLLTGVSIHTGVIQLSGSLYTGIVFTTSGILHIMSSESIHNTLSITTNGLSIQSVSGTWDGALLPPSILDTNDIKRAQFGDTGIPEASEGNITRNILTTIQVGATTDSLIASGGYFNINMVVSGAIAGDILKIYRSENGDTWIANTPQTTCTINSNLVCNFNTNQLSYFSPIKEVTITPINNTGTIITNGGGGMLVKDVCTLGSKTKLPGANGDGIDYSPSYYDKTCSISSSKNIDKNISCSEFSDELNEAYEFARSFDITTINSCTDANMKNTLIRKDLAKMIVNFAENIFNKTSIVINSPRCSQFKDISNEDSDTQNYIQKICEYGLMGLESDGETPQKNFNPYGVVSRAQFGTILSRLIWGSEYNTNNTKLYYTKHLQTLKNLNIMTDISNPQSKEVRGYVMLMMKRIYDRAQ